MLPEEYVPYHVTLNLVISLAISTAPYFSGAILERYRAIYCIYLFSVILRYDWFIINRFSCSWHCKQVILFSSRLGTVILFPLPPLYLNLHVHHYRIIENSFPSLLTTYTCINVFISQHSFIQNVQSHY